MNVPHEYRRLGAFAAGWLTDDERKRVEFLRDALLSASRNSGRLTSNAYDDWRRPLIRDFSVNGALCVFDVPEGRGDDFADNQGMGAWGERLFEEAINSEAGDGMDLVAVRLGPSDGVLPGDGDYGVRRREYRAIEAVEGKRPDYLLFRRSEATIGLDFTASRLTASERDFVRRYALAGIEIKHSGRHHGAYAAAKGRALSYTLKVEEHEGMVRWQTNFGVPILMVQFFLDRVHAVSFDQFNCIKGNARRDPDTKKSTWFVPIPETDDFASIEGGPDYQAVGFDADGRVKRPKRWPEARLVGHDFARLVTLAERRHAEAA